MYSVRPISDLRVSDEVVRFEGGETAISVIVTEFEPGNGTSLHRHPYEEVFLIESGNARFVVGEESVVVGPGSLVTVAANTPHGYGPVGDEPLRVVGIHPSGAVQQENLGDTISG